MSEKLTLLDTAQAVDTDGDYLYIVQYINDATPHWDARKITPQDLAAAPAGPSVLAVEERVGDGAAGITITTSLATVSDGTGTIQVTIAAEENDLLLIDFSGHVYTGGGTGRVETSFAVNGTNVRSSTNVIQNTVSTGNRNPITMQWLHTVTAGDISGGNVTVALLAREVTTSSEISNDSFGIPVLTVINCGSNPQGPIGPVGATGATGATGPEGGKKLITQTAHGFAVGDVVRLNGSASYTKAQANSVANAAVAGVVSIVPDANSFWLRTSGHQPNLTGLTAGTTYFLSATTAGALTATEPVGVSVVTKPVLVADTTTSGFVRIEPIRQWQLVIDEDGSSLANWTNISGTWTSEAGPYFKQADTSATYRGMYYTTPLDLANGPIIMQADVRFPTSGTSDRRAGLAPVATGLLTGVSVAWGALGDTDVSWISRGDQSNNSVSTTVADDTWYTLRVIVNGDVISVYKDGVFLRANRVSPTGALGEEIAHFAQLWEYKGEIHYRNIKLWRLQGPV